tara:strand:- start:1142 stop:1537 length:396 start_codon:yes stop_codon:yes gene_type:complete
MLLEGLIEQPSTWFTLFVGVAIIIVQFLFVGEKAFARDWFKSKEKKLAEERTREGKDIIELKGQVRDLTNKLIDAMDELHEARIEITALKGQLDLQTATIERNERLLQGIKKYMEESKQDTNLINLLSKAS